MPEPEPAVQIDRVRYRYGEREALAGLSLEAVRGEALGVLGPNGSGKSTLFRILTTLLPPREGSARVAGFDVSSEPHEVRRRIGVVFQSPSLDKKLTARENLRHQGRLYGLPGGESKRRVARMLERTGLAERADDLVETLSGGQKRRVEIAKGLLHDPQVLILDEPGTGLDPAARLDLWAYLEQVRLERKVTVLLTTHDMEEAARCDRVAILDRGSLVALGTPSALVGEVGQREVVEVRPPNLSDVFLKRTGRGFWERGVSAGEPRAR